MGDICDCKDPFYRIEGVCGECPIHSFYFFSDEKCYCRFGFKRINGLCQCPKDKVYDEIADACVQRCTKLNEAWIEGECRCPLDYVIDDAGRCYPPCGVFEERVNGICKCIAGYHKGVLGPCVEITCPEGFQWH